MWLSPSCLLEVAESLPSCALRICGRCVSSHSNHAQTECTKELTMSYQRHDPVYPVLSVAPCENKVWLLQLLTEPHQCYLVLLTATAGMTFRGKQSSPQAAAPQETHQASALAADEQALVSSVHACDCDDPAICMCSCSLSAGGVWQVTHCWCELVCLPAMFC